MDQLPFPDLSSSSRFGEYVNILQFHYTCRAWSKGKGSFMPLAAIANLSSRRPLLDL